MVKFTTNVSDFPSYHFIVKILDYDDDLKKKTIQNVKFSLIICITFLNIKFIQIIFNLHKSPIHQQQVTYLHSR